MANTKKPFYISVGTTAALQVQLDDDIYTAQVQTATGITATKPANTVKIIPISTRYALLSKLVVFTKMRITKGTGEEQKVRSYQFLTEVSKADTAADDLVGKIINVGNGAGVAWTIV